MNPTPSEQSPPPADAAEPKPPRGANAFGALVGSILGAAIAGGTWVWLAYLNQPDIAWGLAILLGGMAGFLGALLAGGRNIATGVIAALVAAIAITASAYAAYSVGLHSEAGRAEYQRQFDTHVRTLSALPSDAEYDAAFETHLARQRVIDSNPQAFLRWLYQKGADAIVPAMMSICGIFFAFAIGAGQGCLGGQCRGR